MENKTKLTLGELINIADHGYASAAFGDIGEVKSFFVIDHEGDTVLKKPIRDNGDTLAQFIAIELAETYASIATRDEQFLEAMRVMHTAMRQIESVYNALEKAYGKDQFQELQSRLAKEGE